MDYEIAKQLKDAGWPQDIGQKIGFNVEGISGWYTFPTISELIEACGEDFGQLVKNKTDLPGLKWDCFTAFHIETKSGQGETPEEAVANLWLALNKHD